ncbi:MAG: [FeFe] hydrogenase H-cluster maturation GTPase HydF [Clostridiales Family XIII bacterium]|jgi:[FeFe] hydrogenase H-cluster maturation GTPase HydF|nr:[FeFe] hydrogenase H-cluster maturation GTPase HydF [Clostridiales Family XIII bacterium]
MGLNDTPAGERVAIGFFGRRNTGKSSIVNAVTGQRLSVVSDVKGTTTDPVYKAMELLPLGPVMIVDTPGVDDEGALGALRVGKTRAVLNRIDLAVLVADAAVGKTAEDEELISLFRAKRIPFIVAYNKSAPPRGGSSLSDGGAIKTCGTCPEDGIRVNALTGYNIEALKEKLATLVPADDGRRRLIGDLLDPSDLVVLVVPIDKAAPKGRLILPQQQTIRDVLEAGAAAVVVREHELRNLLGALGKKPKLVVTDSQVFADVAAHVPADVPLTSFSILFARYKGDLTGNVKGVRALDDLKDGSRVLISEGCTHHRQCDDIGTVKLPRWIADYTKKDIGFDFTSGGDFPDDISGYGLIVHCGGCMLNGREMRHRRARANDAGVPMTNYGILIAHVQGILRRTLTLFPEVEDPGGQS